MFGVNCEKKDSLWRCDLIGKVIGKQDWQAQWFATPALGTLRKEDTKPEVLLGCIVSCWITQQDSDSASKEGKGREEKWRKGKGGEGKEMGRAMGKREGQGCHELSTPMGTRCSMNMQEVFIPVVQGWWNITTYFFFFFLNFTIIILCVSAFVCMYIASSSCRECIAFSGPYREAGTRHIWHILTPLGCRV